MAGMDDIGFSMALRDIIDGMVTEALAEQRPRYRYATVDSIDYTAGKCGVIFTGESGAVSVNMGAVIRPNAVNQIVRVEGIGTDKYITDVIGGISALENTVNQDRSDAALDRMGRQILSLATKSQFAMMGGGQKDVDASFRVSWSDRFIMIGTNKGAGTGSTTGFFDITMPPDGTAIPNITTGTNVIVGASLPKSILLPAWGSLWYIPPLGLDNSSQPGNFRICSYNQADYAVSEGWVLVCAVNSVPGSPAIKWGTGETGDYLRGFTMVNGWVNYNIGYSGSSYRKPTAGIVEMFGLVKSGTAGLIGTLPVGYRPENIIMFATDSNNLHGRFNVGPDGAVTAITYNNAWISITCTFSSLLLNAGSF